MTGSVQVNKGKWYCILNMKDENGKRKQKWISTGLTEKGNKKKAKECLQQLLQQYSNHDVITNYANMPFDMYCKHWLESRRESIEVSTFEGYEVRIAHIVNYFRPLKITLSKVTSRHIKDFYDYLLINGNMAKYKKHNGLSERSIKEISLIVKAIFKEAVLLGDITTNPASSIPIPRKRAESVKPDVFIDKDDMKTLFQEIQGHRLEKLIIITLYYGLRRSEVLGIKWSAVDFAKHTLSIEHTVVKVKSTIEKDSTKTQSSLRTYPMSEYIENIFRSLKQQQEYYKTLWGNEYHYNDYVFTWEDGRRYAPDYVTKTFKKIVSKSETLSSQLTFHDLRKSCVSMLIEQGHSIKEIQQWVGHKDTRTTLNIYAKVKDSKKKNIANNLEETFRAAS